jgi:hypothetical protein
VRRTGSRRGEVARGARHASGGPSSAPRGLAAWIERHLVAAALAEDGLAREAEWLCRGEPEGPPAGREDPLDALLRARGVRMLCGVLSPAALAARR